MKITSGRAGVFTGSVAWAEAEAGARLLAGLLTGVALATAALRSGAAVLAIGCGGETPATAADVRGVVTGAVETSAVRAGTG
ncbi:MAG TPA: hypothetical protein VFS60_09760, partial [Thermoanaerobaculia bacterium]|nr:hypothetical protein [Thermoanaerobaculia bacterium]